MILVGSDAVSVEGLRRVERHGVNRLSFHYADGSRVNLSGEKVREECKDLSSLVRRINECRWNRPLAPLSDYFKPGELIVQGLD